MTPVARRAAFSLPRSHGGYFSLLGFIVPLLITTNPVNPLGITVRGLLRPLANHPSLLGKGVSFDEAGVNPTSGLMGFQWCRIKKNARKRGLSGRHHLAFDDLIRHFSLARVGDGAPLLLRWLKSQSHNLIDLFKVLVRGAPGRGLSSRVKTTALRAFFHSLGLRWSRVLLAAQSIAFATP